MKPMDALIIEAGQIIHFQGVPLLLADSVRMMGNKAYFKTRYGIVIEATSSASAAGSQVGADADKED